MTVNVNTKLPTLFFFVAGTKKEQKRKKHLTIHFLSVRVRQDQNLTGTYQANSITVDKQKERIMKNEVFRLIGSSVVFIGIVVLIAVLMAVPLMLLWNWLFPPIFGICKIGFWQALGLNVMSAILFKNTSSSND